MKKSGKMYRSEVIQYQQDMKRILANIEKQIIQQEKMREDFYLEILEDIKKQKNNTPRLRFVFK